MSTDYTTAAARVAEYLHVRDQQATDGNIGDQISTATATDGGQTIQGTLNHTDLATLLTDGMARAGQNSPRFGQNSPLALDLHNAATRIHGYVAQTRDAQEGHTPAHWGILDPAATTSAHPALAMDRGDTVEVLGTLGDLDPAELDLIGLFSPQTAASIGNLLDSLATWLETATATMLPEAIWLAAAAATVALALNRTQAWSAHPSGTAAPEVTE